MLKENAKSVSCLLFFFFSRVLFCFVFFPRGEGEALDIPKTREIFHCN